jgi:hypothetical protein
MQHDKEVKALTWNEPEHLGHSISASCFPRRIAQDHMVQVVILDKLVLPRDRVYISGRGAFDQGLQYVIAAKILSNR